MWCFVHVKMIICILNMCSVYPNEVCVEFIKRVSEMRGLRPPSHHQLWAPLINWTSLMWAGPWYSKIGCFQFIWRWSWIHALMHNATALPLLAFDVYWTDISPWVTIKEQKGSRDSLVHIKICKCFCTMLFMPITPQSVKTHFYLLLVCFSSFCISRFSSCSFMCFVLRSCRRFVTLQWWCRWFSNSQAPPTTN